MSEQQNMKVGIFAASSAVPMFEFERGINHLRATGFDPVVHAQVPTQHFTFAGRDDERAAAIYEYATDPNVSVLWAARGGYGAGRLLPLLDDLTAQCGAPPRGKLLVGYSDVTVLHEFVRQRWGWSTLHAPMPAASNFSTLEANLARMERVPIEWIGLIYPFQRLLLVMAHAAAIILMYKSGFAQGLFRRLGRLAGFGQRPGSDAGRRAAQGVDGVAPALVPHVQHRRPDGADS